MDEKCSIIAKNVNSVFFKNIFITKIQLQQKQRCFKQKQRCLKLEYKAHENAIKFVLGIVYTAYVIPVYFFIAKLCF